MRHQAKANRIVNRAENRANRRGIRQQNKAARAMAHGRVGAAMRHEARAQRQFARAGWVGHRNRAGHGWVAGCGWRHAPQVVVVRQAVPNLVVPAGHYPMLVTVPPGFVGGELLQIATASGVAMNIQVPAGMFPGSQFYAMVPQAAPQMVAAPMVAAAPSAPPVGIMGAAYAPQGVVMGQAQAMPAGYAVQGQQLYAQAIM